MDFLHKLPKPLLIALALYVGVVFSYAVFTGRSVDTPILKVGAAAATSNSTNSSSTDHDSLSENDLIKILPTEVQKLTLNETAEEVKKLIALSSTQQQKINSLSKKVDIIKNLESDFIFRLLAFNKEASCYGDSLNFTYISQFSGTKNCTKKSELAKRFLGFLAEINFYDGDIIESPKIAENELINYQETKEFGHPGYYGRDVFKWILLDYNGKV